MQSWCSYMNKGEMRSIFSISKKHLPIAIIGSFTWRDLKNSLCWMFVLIFAGAKSSSADGEFGVSVFMRFSSWNFGSMLSGSRYGAYIFANLQQSRFQTMSESIITKNILLFFYILQHLFIWYLTEMKPFNRILNPLLIWHLSEMNHAICSS